MKKLAEKVRKVSIIIDQKDFQKLQKMARNENKRLSQVLREALTFYIEKRKISEKKPLKRLKK